jgi:hypothetical protein
MIFRDAYIVSWQHCSWCTTSDGREQQVPVEAGLFPEAVGLVVCQFVAGYRPRDTTGYANLEKSSCEWLDSILAGRFIWI